MSFSDADSSGSEDESYTETGVLLGYASKEPTDDTISQLGGSPTWLDSKTAPSGHLSKCKVCNGYLTLLLQLNGDLPERFPGHERRLYLLACRKKICRRKEGSIRGFRATRASKTSASTQQAAPAAPAQSQPAQRQDLGSSLFGVKPSSTSSASTNPFSSGSSSSPLAQSNPFASASSLAAKPPQPPSQDEPVIESTTKQLAETFASKARISSSPPSTSPPQPQGPSEPWPSPSACPPSYPAYYLDADYETLDPTSSSTIPPNARIDMDIDSGEGPSNTSNSLGGQEDKDVFESSMDRAFQRFADRVGQNPEQVLRYDFGGQPLLYAKDDGVGRLFAHSNELDVKVKTTGGAGHRVPRCGNCGGERVFEVQLTPHAITELEAEELGIEGMEWGTVILMVCGRDCTAPGVDAGELGYNEEWVGVQWEEVIKRTPPKGSGRLQ